MARRCSPSISINASLCRSAAALCASSKRRFTWSSDEAEDWREALELSEKKRDMIDPFNLDVHCKTRLRVIWKTGPEWNGLMQDECRALVRAGFSRAGGCR